MTVDADVIRDAAIPVDVTTPVDVTIPVAATMVGVPPCLAVVEITVPVFSGSSACCAAVETTMAVDATTTDAAMTAAGSSSFFCFAAEITDADAADFFLAKGAEVTSSALYVAVF